MSRGRPIGALACMVLVALIWPAASSADHVTTSATVSAQVTERKSSDLWVVEINWTASCQGTAPGTAWYDGHLYMIDADTEERIYVGGVVDTSGQRTVSGTRSFYVAAGKRSRRLIPELTIGCFENFPLHGGPDVTVTGSAVIIPPRFGGGGGGSGGGAGGGGRDGGAHTDPTAPLGANGCVKAVLGTNGADTLKGSDGGDVIIGFGAKDRVKGLLGHDCLIGGTGNDRMDGGPGNDRLTGGRGKDVLIDGDGINAYDAGSGNDFVNARNGAREPVRCGPGRDRASVDRNDRVRGCERVSHSASGGNRGAARMLSATRPHITRWLIPFPPKRKREMARYSMRHYGERTWRLRGPQVIVEHVAAAGSAAAVHNTFAPDVRDPELHELPNVCAHFVVSSSGRIYQLVPLTIRCRHTVGLNWTAIGIEHVGFRDSEVLDDRRQMWASLRLTRYLRCRFQIRLRDVIGHNESLSSPHHRERVPSLRNQTHGDWKHGSMQVYRGKLRRLGPCGAP